uniref:Mitochondrial import inner membrane translocase subunit n=1 Tax=Tetraselmis sp. GSL018 TaxID=582737 RepID=A0A061QXJ9_9CHLO
MDTSDPAKAMAAMEMEMEYRVELFNKMTANCYDKCVEKRYNDNDLSVGENSCLDRCCNKYWQVTAIIGQMMGNAASQ